jgi:hypothetical protein
MIFAYFQGLLIMSSQIPLFLVLGYLLLSTQIGRSAKLATITLVIGLTIISINEVYFVNPNVNKVFEKLK